MTSPVISIPIKQERDVVVARQTAREVALAVRLDPHGATQMATAVSELARHVLAFGSGAINLRLDEEKNRQIVVEVRCAGSRTQFARTPSAVLALASAERLMDGTEVLPSSEDEIRINLRKSLPDGVDGCGKLKLSKIALNLSHQPARLMEELRQQNTELLSALDELNQKQQDLARLNGELEETNRGVLALYAELDERAEHLRQADQMKSRFLSHMSHEFRTPLNAITGLTGFLLNRSSDNLQEEQVKQIQYIRKSAGELSELVNDLLDLAKVEAGKLAVQASEFSVSSLLSALRGMFRPLLTSEHVSLTVEDPPESLTLVTDEMKLAQILRNFISNAIKFTDQGDIKVTATHNVEDDTVKFSVQDTGIGIASEHQRRIFDEFTQIDGPVQRRVKGTGLGLPLCNKLTELLGGHIELESHVNVGSTFSAVIPRVILNGNETVEPAPVISAGRQLKVLVIDDDEVSRYLLQGLLTPQYDLRLASSGEEGIRAAADWRPDAIFLDLNMPEMGGAEVLEQLRADAASSTIPTVIATSQMLEDEPRAELSRHCSAILSKATLARAEAISIELGPPFTIAVQTTSVADRNRNKGTFA